MANTATNYNDDVIVEDGENYSNDRKVSFQLIVLEQLRRCCAESSKSRTDEQKEIFTLCIETLQILLYPKLVSNKELLDQLIAIDKKLNQIREELHQEIIKDSSGKNIERLQLLNDPLRFRLYQQKFLILSQLLAEINYFEETSGVFNFD